TGLRRPMPAQRPRGAPVLLQAVRARSPDTGTSGGRGGRRSGAGVERPHPGRGPLHGALRAQVTPPRLPRLRVKKSTLVFSMPFQEVVEAEGHLIDSHVVENAFDKVVEFHGRFEVDQFRIGRTNSEPSYLRMKVDAPDEASLERLLEALLELGCAPVDAGDATLREVERDRCAPEDFYSTTNHRTSVRHGQKWIEVEDQRMDAMIVVRENRAF